jgi:hypothetical protein
VKSLKALFPAGKLSKQGFFIPATQVRTTLLKSVSIPFSVSIMYFDNAFVNRNIIIFYAKKTKI